MCNYYNVLSLSATELTRALSILKELLSQAETDLSEVDDDILEPLENTVDTLSSPLFNTLVDIQHKYEVVSNVMGVVCHVLAPPILDTCQLSTIRFNTISR